MPDWHEIYQQHAIEYDQLVAHEDYQHNLPQVLDQVLPNARDNVIELGAGTGRLTCLLAPLVKTILALDISHHMLKTASANLKRMGAHNWQVGVADHRHVPAGDGTADAAIAGWTLCYLINMHPDTWRTEIDRALGQMARILRPGGVVIILETLGTGQVAPKPPTAELAAYYEWLEKERGFSHTWIRTDYNFHSTVEAESLIRFFFGDGLGDHIGMRFAQPNALRANPAAQKSYIVPECTGIWWLKVI